jgi:peptide/nickel transport system permease protein
MQQPRAWKGGARRLLSALAWLPVLGFLLFLGVALLAPWLAPHDPNVPAPGAGMLLPPMTLEGFPLGTDSFGRDQLSRLLLGARPLVLTAILSVAVAVLVGGTLGLAAGVEGGFLGGAIMRSMDVLMSFPLILAAILVVAALGPTTLNMILAISVSQVPVFARLSQSLAAGEASKDYVVAARALGFSRMRVMFSEVAPNVVPALIVQATSAISTAALTSAALSYLGLGVQPPTPDWGYMVKEAQEFIFFAPDQALIPGALIAAFSVCCAFLGDLATRRMREREEMR